MGSIRAELAVGLRATAANLFSHHGPDEYDRCYSLGYGDRTLRFCARCTGIYAGIAAGSALVTAIGVSGSILIIAILPAFALIDWALTAFTDVKSANSLRTATGALLGCGYALGLARLLGDPPAFDVLAVGLVYVVLAGTLLLAESFQRQG
jgi:uncharacterized membrane protein